MTWDYIVVGAGSAGCALVHELVQSGARVLLIEAGGPDCSPWIRLASTQVRAVARHDWGYRAQPDPTRNNLAESWPRGKVLGGSSSINGTMYVRGAAQDFDRWAQVCAHTGSWAALDVMPLFRDLETSDQTGELRGTSGRVHVRTVKRPHAITQLFVQSAVACGFPFRGDYNGEAQEGVGYAQLSQRGGLRWSAADAFLRPINRRGNLRLALQARVHRLELSDRRAVAVRFWHEGREHREAARNIVLCAGALDSPKLLMLSGIGPAAELMRQRIPVIIDAPGVGCNLREHPLLRLVYRTRIPTYNLTEGWPQKLDILWRFLTSGEGPLSNLFEAAAFLRSAASEAAPDIQLHLMPFGYVGTPATTFTLAPFPSLTVLLNKSHPRSTGQVRLASADPADPPLIECRLCESATDVNTLVRGIELVRAIMQQQPIAPVIEHEAEPGAGVTGKAALEAYVRSHASIAFHPAGTCRMGADDAAVVGPDLRVYGMENLWIADASIMPDLISGNTHAACMMIGHKLGRQLVASEHAHRH